MPLFRTESCSPGSAWCWRPQGYTLVIIHFGTLHADQRTDGYCKRVGQMITKLGTTDEAKLHLSVVLTGQGRKRSTDHRLEEQKEYFKSR